MEKKRRFSPETHKQLNAISIDEFKIQQVHDPLPYKDGEPITRNNITSWFVRGFAVSRGDPAVQYGYIRWSASQTGLDFQKTLKNFVRLGAEKCLSEEERQVIIKAYNSVKIHEEIDRRNIEEEEIEEAPDPVSDLGYYAVEFADDNEYQDELLKDFPRLDTVDNLSKAEFMKWADERYKITLAKRKERERTEQKIK